MRTSAGRIAKRAFCTGRSWQPGSSLTRQISRKPAAKSLVGSDVHGKSNTHVQNPDALRRPLFRRGGVDRMFTSGEEAAELISEEVRQRDSSCPLVVKTVDDTVRSLVPVFDKYPTMAWAFKNMVEPDRVVQFRVPWTDDQGNSRINRGFRVQHSSVLGPYVGGISFAPDMSLDILRAQALEQTLQNALTGLRVGGARGGSDFDPASKSQTEIKAFCQSFITELSRYIGPHLDIPCGGLGVGEREIGYMYGQYKRLTQRFDGALSGDAVSNDLAPDVYLNRERAAGAGMVMFAKQCVEASGGTLVGARCVISGSGNVSLATARALVDIGAIPVTLSDRSGYILEPNGFDHDMLDSVERVKRLNPYAYGRRVSGYTKHSPTAKFVAGKPRDAAAEEQLPNSAPSVYDVPCDYVFPCASSNELGSHHAMRIMSSNAKGAFEGALSPCTGKAIDIFRKAGNFIYAPSKAANSGGVIVAGMTMARMGSSNTGAVGETTQAQLLSELTSGINRVYEECLAAQELYGVDLTDATNVAGFSRIAHAMLKQGYV